MTAQKYYKRGTITAEQFDGSWEMIQQYGLEVDDMPLDGLVTSITTQEGPLLIKTGDWIATGVNGEHWPIADEIFHATYAPLPVIPQKVADYIRKAKAGTWGILDLFWYIGDSASAVGVSGMYGWQQWIVNHQDVVAQAWMMWPDVQIEEEAK